MVPSAGHPGSPDRYCGPVIQTTVDALAGDVEVPSFIRACGAASAAASVPTAGPPIIMLDSVPQKAQPHSCSHRRARQTILLAPLMQKIYSVGMSKAGFAIA
jgi:hypothetical protein